MCATPYRRTSEWPHVMSWFMPTVDSFRNLFPPAPAPGPFGLQPVLHVSLCILSIRSTIRLLQTLMLMLAAPSVVRHARRTADGLTGCYG